MEHHKQILDELNRLENRIRCYHEGTHGRRTVKMHVELEIIDNIKEMIDSQYADSKHDSLFKLNPEIKR